MATKYNFSDVFISYAREDTPFVRTIAADLSSRGYEIWVDWEDIPETADWWQEICAGIDAANTFLFVVSPASAISEVCFKEVEHAYSNHKRIVPLLAKSIQDDTVMQKLHQSIRSHNWFNFENEELNFEQKLSNLLKILELNLENTRLHTRYLVRAREWDERRRDRSFLLRGMDAYEAKLWLDANQKNESSPSLSLHHDYIEASLRQKEYDEALQSQQATVRYIDIRTMPAFFISASTIGIYAWLTIPYPDLQARQRIELAFGLSITAGIIMAALILYADELLRLRYPNNRQFRFAASFMYGFVFGSSLTGFLQSMFFGPPLDWLPVFTAGLAIGLGVMFSSTFKLKGWQSFLITAPSIFIGIQLTYASPERLWAGFRPIFYFNSNAEAQWLSIVMAVALAFAMFATPIIKDILSLVRKSQIQA
jgi:hypothetical protein